jgi:autotransporter-associated beta strand protein
MNPPRKHYSRFAACLAGAISLAATSAHAQTYFWDGNDTTAGFGTAGGTWAAPTPGTLTSGWSTDGTGAAAVDGNSITTLTTDALNFGNGATGLGAGTIAVSGTVNSGNMTFASGSGAIVLSGGIINFAATSSITVNNTENTISSAISGAGTSLTKAGTGKLTLSGANSYTGTTTISAGTLALTGGDNRLATTGTVAFSGTSTLSIANKQTLSNVTVVTEGVTGTINGGGDLTLTGSSFSIGAAAASSGTVTRALNMSGLGSFTYNNSGGTFSVGGTPTGGNGTAAGTVTLPGEATITASVLGVGNSPHPSNGGRNTGTLTLGQTADINANTITVGTTRATGTIQYGTVTAPTLTLRGSDGIGAVTTMTIGSGTSTASTVYVSTVNLTGGVTGSTSTALDAKITTLNIGYVTATSGQSGGYTGSLLMGNGTLDADTIYLGRNVTTGGASAQANGTLTVTGGTVKAKNLYLGDQQSSTATSTVSGTFNLNGGANLYAQTIGKGPGTGTQAATRTFNWNNGTIRNYDSSTDLTIGSFGGTATFALIGADAHTFDISTGRQGTVHQAISGSGSSGLTKAGDGTLRLAATNNYTGSTTVSAGTLQLGAGDTTGSLTGTSDITNNANLTINRSDAFTQATDLNNKAITGTGSFTQAGAGTTTLSLTNTYEGNTLVSAGTLYVTGALSNSAVSVGANATIGGTGSLGNGLAFAGDSFLEVVDFNDPLAVTGTITFGGGFGIDNLLGIDWDSLTANTPYTVLSTGQSFSTSDIDNFGYDNRVAVGSGRQAYFTNGSLAVIVIPEPGAALLGGLGLLVLLRRRR